MMKKKVLIIAGVLLVAIIFGFAYMKRAVFLGHDYIVLSQMGPGGYSRYYRNPLYHHSGIWVKSVFFPQDPYNQEDWDHESPDMIIVLDNNDWFYIKVIKYPEGFENSCGGNAYLTEDNSKVIFMGREYNLGDDSNKEVFHKFEYDMKNSELEDLGVVKFNCNKFHRESK